MLKRLVCWLGKVAFCCSFSALVSASELTLYTETFPPYNFSQDDKIKGINADIVVEACERAGLDCTVVLENWNRAMANTLANPYSGLFSTSRTTQREDLFQWVGPLVSSNSCLYRLKERADIHIQDRSSLLNYTVGIARGDVYQHVMRRLGLQEGQHFLTYSNKLDDLHMFVLNKHDLIVSSPLSLRSQLAKVNLDPERVVPVYEIRDPALKGNFLALNKEVKASTVASLQKQIELMKSEGRFEQVVFKYVTVPENGGEADPRIYGCVNNPVTY